MTRWDSSAQHRIDGPAGAAAEPAASGLWTLWRWIKRLAATLVIAVIGGMIGAVTGGAATFYCYGIGLYLGLPVGFVAGSLLGWRIPPRDAVLVLAGTVSMLYFADAVNRALRWDPVFGDIGIAVTGSLAAPLVYGLCRLIPPEWRYYMAVASAWIMSLTGLLVFTRWLNSQGS